jgi:hypothetical protein
VEQKEKWFFEGMGIHTSNSDNFAKIPGSPIAYWISKAMLASFVKGVLVCKLAIPKQGMSTCDVNRFTKLWYEPKINDTNILFRKNHKKWVIYNKGGEFRKWYGNRDSLVYWNENGEKLRENNATLRNQDSYFHEFIAWTKISSAETGFRDFEEDFLFDGAGGSLFLNDNKNKMYFLGCLNSCVCNYILSIISPTLNFNESHIGNISIMISADFQTSVTELVIKNITISRTDWDSFETSWDFKRHPLI